MHTRFLPAAFLLASLAAAAGAQDYFWTITDSGDGDGIIEPGEEALIDLEMVWGPPGVAFAYSYCDVIGIEGWADGEVLEAAIWTCSEVLGSPPRVDNNNDIREIENFQLPGAFQCDCCGDTANPTPQLHLRWQPSGYFDHTVTILPVNFLDYWDGGNPEPNQIRLYTDAFGSTIALRQTVTELTFPVRCPADWNDDAQLNAADFHAFLAVYLDPESGLQADFNEDGRLDTRDLTAYLNAWVRGC